MSYPTPPDLLAASQDQPPGTKGALRLFEDDFAIKHMIEVTDKTQLAGEKRFEEVSRRLAAEGIEISPGIVKSFRECIGRPRSGFDERSEETAALSTSKASARAQVSKQGLGEEAIDQLRPPIQDTPNQEATIVPPTYFEAVTGLDFEKMGQNRSDTAVKTRVIAEKALHYILDLEIRVNRTKRNRMLAVKLEENRGPATRMVAQLLELQEEIESLVSRNAKTLVKVVELQDVLTKLQTTEDR